jgi:hypothetical protein
MRTGGLARSKAKKKPTGWKRLLTQTRHGSHNQMGSGHIFIFAALLWTTACAKAPPREPINAPRLYLSIQGGDSFFPEQYNPGRAGGSSLELAAALKACGNNDFILDGLYSEGENVSVRSRGNDAAVVSCVKRRVVFGFSAHRATLEGRSRGDYGTPVGVPDGS